MEGLPDGTHEVSECAHIVEELLTASLIAACAHEYAEKSPKRLILIDGEERTRRMIEHRVGVRTHRSIELKRIDGEYFEDIEG